MTLGTFMPLVAALAGLGLVFAALVRIRTIPSRTDADYDPVAVERQRRTAFVMIVAGLATPVAMYALVNLVMADLGLIELF